LASRRAIAWVLAAVVLFGSLLDLTLCQVLIFRFGVRGSGILVFGILVPQAMAAVLALLIVVLRRKDVPAVGLVGPLVAIAVTALALGLLLPTVLRALISGAESVPLDGANILYAIPALVVVGWCVYQAAGKYR
jgi:hypothetical protein